MQKNEEEILKLRSENDRLKRLCRFQFLTLGFYGTPYNYSEASKGGTHPSLPPTLGILRDGGEQAREAQEVVEGLKFTGDEIRSWPGPELQTLVGEVGPMGEEGLQGERGPQLSPEQLAHFKDMIEESDARGPR